MIKRLKLFLSQAQNQLKAAFIDKTHNKIKFAYLRRIVKNIDDEIYLKKLLLVLSENLKSSNNQLRIKTLIVIHYLIRRTQYKNQKIIQFTLKQLNQLKNKKSNNINSLFQTFTLNNSKNKIKIQNQQKQYIQKNIIEFYILYLLKFIVSEQSYLFAKKQTTPEEDKNKSNKKKQEQSIKKYHKKLIQTTTTCQTKISQSPNKYKQNQKQVQMLMKINHGFQIINLINFILQSQQSFNKMGRYYRDQLEILDLFLMYLDDLTIYNDYVKKIAKFLTKKVNEFKQDQVKHCYLFITQSQKTSDRLYQFYYNRYYYQKVRNYITLPTFLTIDNQDFQRVIKQVKKVDKQLIFIVKQSKYSQEYKNKTIYNLTQGQQQKYNKNNRMNKTLNTEINFSIKSMKSSNKTIEDLKFNKKNINKQEENITQYIECFEDIYDQQQTTINNQDQFI